MSMIICPRCWNQNSRCDKCDNKGRIDDTRLSEHFTLGELTDSPTARRLSIPNDPTVRQVDRLRALVVNLLQPLRSEVGLLNVTSGFRSTELNSAIKGAKDSAHMMAWAADVEPEQCTLQDLMHWASKTKLPFDQVIIEHQDRPDGHPKEWVHFGWKHPSGAQRRQLLVMRNGSYTPWVA